MEEPKQNLKEPLISDSQQIKIKPVPLLSLFKYSDRLDKVCMILGTLASIAAGASMPFFMIFFSQLTEIFVDGNQSSAQEKGLAIAIKFFILGGGTWFLSFFGIYMWGTTGNRQTLRFKKIYYKTLLEQETAWFDSNDVNKLASEISSNMIAVETAIGQKISFLLATTVTSIFGFFYAYFKCWQLSLVLTGFLPLLLIAGVLLMKSMQLKAELSKVSFEDASGVSQQAFSSIRTVKSFVAQQFENNRFIKSLSTSQKKVTKYIIFSSLGLAGMTFVFLGLYSFGFWYGKQLIIWSPEIYTAPIVISTFFCFLIGGASVGQISPLLKNIAEGQVAAGKLYYLVNRKKTLIQPEPGVKAQEIESIKLQNITFKYEKLQETESFLAKQNKVQTSEGPIEKKDEIQTEQKLKIQVSQKLVLDNVSLEFKKGEVTAIVGESGSGKSTIVQLLMRYYDPTFGNIVVNDSINMKDLDIKSFRQKIGYVGQEPVLFSMSIAQNIKLSNPDISNEELQQVLKKANAWQFVEKCQNGVQTYVGSGGTQISGGQKQRIAIARALAKNPNILILDEATSALDRKNQKEIQETLNKLAEGNITTIVIAHRLSTIRNAGKIIVLGKGRILEQGTHDELYQKQGAYYQLVKSQLTAELQHEEIVQEEKVIQIVKKQQKIISEQKKQAQKKEESKYSQKELNSVFGRLLKQSKGTYHLLFFGCISAFLNGLIWPFFNIAFSNILSLMAQAAEKSDEINMYCFMFLIVAGAGTLTTFLYTFCFGIAGQRLVFMIRKKLFHKLLVLPLSFYDKPENTPGGISTKISQDSYQINNMITGVLGAVFLNIATISTSLIFAFYYSWKLTLIVLGLSPLLVITGAINMQILKGMTSKSEKFEKAIGSMISDTVCNVRTVKSFGNNKAFLDIYSDKINEIDKISSEKNLKSSILQGLSRASVLFVEGFTFWIAAILFANGGITEPKAIYIAIFSIIFAATGVGQNSQFLPDMGKAKNAGAGIFSIFDTKDEVTENKEYQDATLQNIDGDIEFRSVKFKYPEREAIVLKNFNLKITKGEKIAFVGPSGSGKSTLTQILMRYYPIEEGEILVNGVDYRKYNLYKYRRQIGIVSQQPTLFLGTVKQNVVYNTELKGEQEKKQKLIKKSCKISHALDFINQWEEKFNKEVGQKGAQVSGGQKQRIALARCLIRDPKILLLDQSTSALDADTEKIVFQNLKPVLKEKTSISIAHRLSTIQDSDRIIVMRDGEIIEEGRYDELIQKKENFYRLAKGMN